MEDGAWEPERGHPWAIDWAAHKGQVAGAASELSCAGSRPCNQNNPENLLELRARNVSWVEEKRDASIKSQGGLRDQHQLILKIPSANKQERRRDNSSRPHQSLFSSVKCWWNAGSDPCFKEIPTRERLRELRQRLSSPNWGPRRGRTALGGNASRKRLSRNPPVPYFQKEPAPWQTSQRQEAQLLSQM